MTSTGVSVEPYVAQNRLLEVRREVEGVDAGLEVTLTVGTQSRVPIRFQVYDSFPGGFEVGEIGYHPDHEPSHGHIDERMAVIGGVLNPDDEFEVIYGICPVQPRPPEVLEEVQANSPLSIEIDKLVGPEEETEADLAHAIATRSSAPDAGGGPSPELQQLWATVDEGQGDGESGSDSGPDGDEKQVEDAHWTETLFGDLPSDRSAAAVEPAGSSDGEPSRSRASVAGGDPFGESAANVELAAAISRSIRERNQPTSGESSSNAESGPAAAEEPTDDRDHDEVLEWLLGRFVSGELTEDQLRSIATLSGAGKPPASGLAQTEAKLVSIQSAAEAHARIDGVLSDLEARQAAIEDTIDQLESNLVSAAEDREGATVAADSIADVLEELRQVNRAAADELAGRRAIESAYLSQLTRRLADVDEETIGIEGIERELAALVDAARGVEQRRRSLLRALRRTVGDDTS